MTKIELTETIGAAPGDVFVFFVPQRMPYWYGAEMQSSFEVQNGAVDFYPGLKVRISGRLGRRTVSHIATVTAFESPRLFEWSFHDEYGMSGMERWELSGAGGNSGAETVLRFITDYQPSGGVARAVDWLLTRHAVARRSRDYLKRLARLAGRH